MTESNITRLQYQDKEIILVATAHVSKESRLLVKQVIEAERPDSVCIELDEERYQSMQNPQAWQNTDLVKVIKSKRVGFLAVNLFLSSYQKMLAKKLDTPVGGEMRQGIKSAKETGAELVLADRSIQTTFLRIWRKMSLGEKAKLFASLFFAMDEDEDISEQDLQDLMQKDMLESLISGMREKLPQVGEILLSERDQYLAHNIKNAPGPKIVAILGGAHVPGVAQEIFKTQDIAKISSVPPTSRFSQLAGWIIPGALVMLLGYAFIANIETGLQQLSTWVLWTGVLAALFTALSLGHPLSILTSLVAAPFTTINPVLAVGWFTGLVEATIKKPTVNDLQNVSQDIFSLRGFYRNRLLRTILVIFMANLGASTGTIIAGADIIKKLF